MASLPTIRETTLAPRTSPHTLLFPQVSPEIIEQALQIGDISKMSPQVRVAYYIQTCLSIGLNPYTQPFDLIEGDDGTVKQYPNKSCAEQIRKRDQISLPVVSRVRDGDLYIVTVRAVTPSGREEEAQGIVSLVKPVGTWKTAQSGSGKRYFEATKDAAGQAVYEPLRGTELANALMKAETKAKRRATFGIAGLGFDDEEPQGTPVHINFSTGALGTASEEPLPLRVVERSKTIADHIEDLTGVRPPANVQEAPPLPQDGTDGEKAVDRDTEPSDEPIPPLVALHAYQRRQHLCGLVLLSQRSLSDYIRNTGKRCKVPAEVTDFDAILAAVRDEWVERLITEAEAYLVKYPPQSSADPETPDPETVSAFAVGKAEQETVNVLQEEKS